jgi:hypothetical protein
MGSDVRVTLDSFGRPGAHPAREIPPAADEGTDFMSA